MGETRGSFGDYAGVRGKGNGWAMGFGIGLPGGSGTLLREAALRTGTGAVLTIMLLTPVALLASVSRGYLAPIGFAIFTLFIAQITAATGWGAWFPWSVPPLYSGLAGPEGADLPAGSYALVAIVSAVALLATYAWWQRADHTT